MPSTTCSSASAISRWKRSGPGTRLTHSMWFRRAPEWPERGTERLRGSHEWAEWPDAQPCRPLRIRGVPHLRVLAEGCLYVSGQPKRSAYHALVSQGMKAIVNLRAESEMLIRKRVWRVENRMFSIPVPDERAPTDAQAEELLRLAADRANWPLLVHCR